MSDDLYELATKLYRDVGGIIASPVLQEADQPLDRLAAVRALGDQTTAMLSSAVVAARRSGVTWQQVGEVMGVSRQAAFQRFGRPEPVSGHEAEPPAAVEGAAVERARAVVDELARGAWQAVVDRFDDAMRARLSVDGLSAAWSQVVAAVGAFDHGGETRVSRTSGFTITTTPLRFEQDECTARISFWDDGRISGLFILAGSPS